MLLGFFLQCTNKTSPIHKQNLYTVEKGVQDAERNIAAFEATQKPLMILRYGEEAPAEDIDKETGLKIGTLGCEVEAGMDDYLKAYNQKIREYWLSNR